MLLGQDGDGDYVDVDAVRSIARPLLGLAALLHQAWDRYKIPIAVTETHNVGTRDEQMRWILETWRTCEMLRKDGVDITAVTAWTLLGAFDWKTLAVKDASRYEVGVFDLSSGEPRPTALVPLLRALSAGQDPPQPLPFASPGWWRRDVRFEHDTEGRQAKAVDGLIDLGPARPNLPPPLMSPRPILIVGKTGTLGTALVRACTRRGLPFEATGRTNLRMEDRESIDATLVRVNPCAVINAAGWSLVEEAEDHQHRCFDANATGPANLARACKLRDLQLVTISADMVFDGKKGEPYIETDEPNPINCYGRSKAEGERRVLAAGGRNLIVRTSTFFSPYDSNNFAVRMLNELAEGGSIPAATDRYISPTYVPDLVDALLDLVIDGETGIWHITHQGTMSWADFARTVADHAGFDPGSVKALTADELGWRSLRPYDISLRSIRGQLLSDGLSAIDRFLADTRHVSVRRTLKPSADLHDPIVTTAA